MNAIQHAYEAAQRLDALAEAASVEPLNIVEMDNYRRARDDMTAWSILALAENVRDLCDTIKRAEATR